MKVNAAFDFAMERQRAPPMQEFFEYLNTRAGYDWKEITSAYMQMPSRTRQISI